MLIFMSKFKILNIFINIREYANKLIKLCILWYNNFMKNYPSDFISFHCDVLKLILAKR